MNIIENISAILANKKSDLIQKSMYVNQLVKANYYALDLGEYQNKPYNNTEGLIQKIEKNKTKLIVSIKNKRDLQLIQENTKIDIIEIPIFILEELENYVKHKNKILVSIPISYFQQNKIKKVIEELIDQGYDKIKYQNLDETIDYNFLDELLQETIKIYSRIDFFFQIYTTKENQKKIFEILYLRKCKFIEVSTSGREKRKEKELLNSEKIFSFLIEKKQKLQINLLMFESSYNTAKKYF